MIGLSATRKELFYTELSKLTGAGFGIREAARTMIESSLPAAERGLLESVVAGLDQGKSIGGSFAAAGVPELDRMLVEAGEKSGKPEPAFAHLAGYYGMLAEARRQTSLALIYPMILLHLGLLLAALPSDIAIHGFQPGQMAMRFVIGLAVTYGVLAAGYAGVRWMISRAPQDEGIDRRLGSLPVLGKARTALALARFARVFHAGLLAGLPMRETVRMAGEASQSGRVAAASARIATVVKDGGAVGPVMAGEPVFPKAFARSYATAEESGTLDADMDRWAKHFAADATDRVKRLTIVLPKIGYLLIVAFVVWKILAFYAGYYGAIERELGL